MDDYGKFVKNYIAYTDTVGGMEYVLGRKPALQALGPVARDLILDFGCGPAVNGKELQAKGADVLGIDISEEELLVARQRDPQSAYLHYDGQYLANAVNAEPRSRGRKLDGIIATFSICTIPDAILRPILRDMRQLLRPGGRLVIAEPNLEQAIGMKYHDLHYHAQPGVKSGDHVRVTLGAGESAEDLYHDIFRSHNDYKHLLEEAGFERVRMFTPRPRGLQILTWWKALLTPPFLIIVTE